MNPETGDFEVDQEEFLPKRESTVARGWGWQISLVVG